MAKPRPQGGIPRGLDEKGPVLFSYGFRPFYLAAAVWAVLSMALWLLVVSGNLSIGGDRGYAAWHKHEMLFGFAPAVLAGFLLTSVPNWSGKLPVSGRPLMALFALWSAGRLAMLLSGILPYSAAAAIDWLFLPVFMLICAREIVAGRKWRDLKPVGVLAVLTLANTAHHWPVSGAEGNGISERLALSAYLLLITVMGGRMVPSFTRNWLNQQRRTDFPASYDGLDRIALGAGLMAFLAWTVMPEGPATAILAFTAGLLHAVRLCRWRGFAVSREPLILALHVAYAFIPLGLIGMSGNALGYLPQAASLHLLSVGALAGMMLAVMARSTLGHTGQMIRGSSLTRASTAALSLSALLRPLADLLPAVAGLLLMAAGTLWILAFGLFIAEYGPLLAKVRRKPIG